MLFLKSGWRCDTWRKCSIPGLGIAMGSLVHSRVDRRGRQFPLGGEKMSWADFETRIKNKITGTRIYFLGHLDSGDVTPSSDFLWYRYYLIRWSLVRVSELCNVNRETVSVKRTSGHSLVLPLNTCCNIDSMIFAVILLLRVLCDDSVLKYTFYLIYTRLTIYSTIA